MRLQIENLMVEVEPETEFRIDLAEVRWEFQMWIEGETRVVGEFYNFRRPKPIHLLFDYKSRDEYGDLLGRDILAGQVQVTAQEHMLEMEEGTAKGMLYLILRGFTYQPEGPSTACAWCGKIFPATHAYKSKRDANVLICPSCHKKGKEGGRVKK